MEFIKNNILLISVLIGTLLLYYGIVFLLIYRSKRKKERNIKNFNTDNVNKENINIFDQNTIKASFNDDNISSPGRDIDKDINWRDTLNKISMDSEEVSHNNSLRNLLGDDDVDLLDEDL